MIKMLHAVPCGGAAEESPVSGLSPLHTSLSSSRPWRSGVGSASRLGFPPGFCFGLGHRSPPGPWGGTAGRRPPRGWPWDTANLLRGQPPFPGGSLPVAPAARARGHRAG